MKTRCGIFPASRVEEVVELLYNGAILEKINTLDLGFSHSGGYVGSVN
jgi:hypothetical protein